MAGVAFAVEGDGVGFATESYAASALCATLASLSVALWRIRRASDLRYCGNVDEISRERAPMNKPKQAKHDVRYLPDAEVAPLLAATAGPVIMVVSTDWCAPCRL